MDFTFDRVRGARATRTNDVIEIVRSCSVKNIPVVEGVTSTDAEVLLKITADPQCPAFFSKHPTDILPWAYCTLQEIVIREWAAPDACLLDLIYRSRAIRGGGAGSLANWNLNYDNTISHIQTYDAYLGELITGWYKAGTAAGTTSKPTGAGEYAIAVPQMRVSGVLTARALLSGDDWRAFKPYVKAIKAFTNSDFWGSELRGHWFFVAPRTQTNDYGKSYTVELNFLENEFGWWPVGTFIDSATGQHPVDSDKESNLPAFGPPMGTTQHLNGLVRASVYGEADFRAIFAFTPDDA